MPGDPGRYPTRGETVEYLRHYAQLTSRSAPAPRSTGCSVMLLRDGPSSWPPARWSPPAPSSPPPAASQPYRPPIDEARYGGRVLHVADYRTPEPFTGQRVVVVGAGNSAIQVAHELAQVTEVTLATRRPVSLRSSRPLGIDLHYWVAWSGIDRLPLGRRAGTSVGVLDDGTYAAALASGRPDRREMFTGFTDDGVRWSDGSTELVEVVIFATGYRPDLGYLPASAFSGGRLAPAPPRRELPQIPHSASWGCPARPAWRQRRCAVSGPMPDAWCATSSHHCAAARRIVRAALSWPMRHEQQGPLEVLLGRLGGRRGLIDGAVPPVAFVAANALADLVVPHNGVVGGRSRPGRRRLLAGARIARGRVAAPPREAWADS